MADDLLALALDDPERAEAPARRFIESATSPHDRAVGHQALAISLRDQGRLAPALAAMRVALASAERAQDADLLADVLGTSGATLAVAGHPRRGLRQLDRS